MILSSPWTPYRISRLEELWDTGLSCSEIAERLGDVNRNAVIGKARRLGLPHKPSPIIRYDIDDERFTKMWDAEVNLTHMGFVFKCPIPYIRQYAYKLGLKRRATMPPYRKPRELKKAALRPKREPIIIGLPPECRCKGSGCLWEAVPGALYCYTHGGDLHA